MMEWDLGDRIASYIPGTGYWEEKKQKQPTPEKEKPKGRGSRDRDASKKAPKKGGKK